VGYGACALVPALGRVWDDRERRPLTGGPLLLALVVLHHGGMLHAILSSRHETGGHGHAVGLAAWKGGLGIDAVVEGERRLLVQVRKGLVRLGLIQRALAEGSRVMIGIHLMHDCRLIGEIRQVSSVHVQVGKKQRLAPFFKQGGKCHEACQVRGLSSEPTHPPAHTKQASATMSKTPLGVVEPDPEKPLEVRLIIFLKFTSRIRIDTEVFTLLANLNTTDNIPVLRASDVALTNGSIVELCQCGANADSQFTH
jgi:hypothetical protein